MFINIFSLAFDVNEVCEDSSKQIIITKCKVTKSKQCGQRQGLREVGELVSQHQGLAS